MSIPYIYQANITLNTTNTGSTHLNYGAIPPSGTGNVVIGGTGGSGIYQVSSGTSTGYAWNGPSTWTNGTQNKLTVSGDAEFGGNIHMNGINLTDVLGNIESRLAILRPNPELEKEWEELAKLREQYVELELKLLEKQRTFDILKKK